MIKTMFNRIGWLTTEQRNQNNRFDKATEELYSLAKTIIDDYEKYVAAQKPLTEDDPLHHRNDMLGHIDEMDERIATRTKERAERRALGSSEEALNEFKTRILDKIEKFKQRREELYGNDGIIFYTTHSKPVQQHVDKKWDGGRLLDNSGRTILTELVGIEAMLKTGERPHPDFRFNWEDRSTNAPSDQMREYYQQLDF